MTLRTLNALKGFTMVGSAMFGVGSAALSVLTDKRNMQREISKEVSRQLKHLKK